MIKFLPPLIASATTAAGGSFLLTPDTPVALGVFVGGIGTVCLTAYWLGQRMSELKQIGESLKAGNERFMAIETRLGELERNPAVVVAKTQNSQTQRVEIP